MSEYRLQRHPLVRRDILNIALHILEVSGHTEAAERRGAEIEEGLQSILENPHSGVRLSGLLSGYSVRHVGHDRKITIVFQANQTEKTVYIVHVAFGGQNWLGTSIKRI